MDAKQERTLAQELSAPTYQAQLKARAYADIAAALNERKTVDNPDKTPREVPITLTLKAIMEDVPPSEMVKAYQLLPGFVSDVKAAIDRQDREYLGGLLQIAVAAGAISTETAGNLAPLLTATETVTPPATIDAPSIAESLDLGTVTADDVQLVAHRYFGG
jgi:hypothetical protein